MSNGAVCDVARPSPFAVTERDGYGAVESELRTADGVRIEARYEPAAAPPGASGVLVLAHGFTGSLDRPALRRAATTLAGHAAVVTFSFRGHGGSGGRSTVGDLEVLDLAAAVEWARSFGHERVTTVGFSMGGSVVLRHGALFGAGTAAEGGAEGPGGHHASERALSLHGGRTGAREAGADAVVAVSAPARWYYRGTAPMRRLHWAVQRPLGRVVARYGLRTRVHHKDWERVPLSPTAAAARLGPAPLLVVHGDRDPYFPLDHPLSLAEAAGPEACELWIEPGFGHAENAAEPALLHRIGAWAHQRSGADDPGGSPAPGQRRHHGTRDAAGPRDADGPRGAESTPGTDG